MKNCIICGVEIGKYKCPICLVYYCSVDCCKKHRENKCEISAAPQHDPVDHRAQTSSPRFVTEDTVSLNKLELLKDSSELKDILANPHLRELLLHINNSPNAEQAMDKAMQEPLFVEFTEAALKVVEPAEN